MKIINGSCRMHWNSSQLSLFMKLFSLYQSHQVIPVVNQGILNCSTASLVLKLQSEMLKGIFIWPDLISIPMKTRPQLMFGSLFPIQLLSRARLCSGSLYRFMHINGSNDSWQDKNLWNLGRSEMRKLTSWTEGNAWFCVAFTGDVVYWILATVEMVL